MIRRLSYLVVGLALTALPSWSQIPAPHSTPAAAPAAEIFQLPELVPQPFLAGCYLDCLHYWWQVAPCEPEDYVCGDYYAEICACNCGLPRHSC